MNTSSKHILDYTVLDLCDETYYDHLGFKAYDLFDNKELTSRSAFIGCINYKINDNKATYDFIHEDYRCFRIQPLPYSTYIKDVFNQSHSLGLPIISEIKELAESCMIIATTQPFWANWFASIFIQGNEALNKSLSPVVYKLLPMLNHIQNLGADNNLQSGEMPDESLSVLMDEAIVVSPRAAVRRWNIQPPGMKSFCAGLLICAAATSPVFNLLMAICPTTKTTSSDSMRTRTLHASLKQAAHRTNTLASHTTDPELFLLVTVDQSVIDQLKNILEI